LPKCSGCSKREGSSEGPQPANIRLRAERRVGELLKELARADHSDAGRASGVVRAGNASPEDTRSISEQARCKGPSPYAQALADHGMTRQTAHRFQALHDERDAPTIRLRARRSASGSGRTVRTRDIKIQGDEGR
jgi:hypothetical protein